MVFPDDEREANPASFKFLEMAHKWKQMQAAKVGSGGLGALLAASNPAPAADNSRGQNDDSDSEMASSNGED